MTHYLKPQEMIEDFPKVFWKVLQVFQIEMHEFQFFPFLQNIRSYVLSAVTNKLIVIKLSVTV